MVSIVTSKNPKITILPATLLKNNRSAVALMCYKYLLKDSSMNIQLQENKVLNYYHGNIEQNNISQVDLLIKGHSNYFCLFDKEVKVTIDRSIGNDSPSIRQLVLKDLYP